MADLEHLGGSRSVALGLLQSAANQDLLDDAHRLFDAQLAARKLHLHRIARFANAPVRLWPGQYIRVALIPRVEPDALSVPAAALQVGQDGRFVFLLQGNQAKRRPVELVRMTAGRAVIRGDFAATDRVIVEGAQRVADGGRAVERNAPPQGTQRISQATR